MTNKTNYAIISIIYEDKKYKSILLDIDDDLDNRELVTLLSESGTTKLSMFKMPTSKTKFIIFSREQLDKAVFEIELLTKINKTITTWDESNENEMIKS
jgi:ABC-type taurine transport system ATPase subunit